MSCHYQIDEAENYWQLNTQKLVLTTKQVSRNKFHAACISRLAIGKLI